MNIKKTKQTIHKQKRGESMVPPSIEVGSLLPMIDSLMKEFTKSEKKVAELVLKQPQQIIYSSITDLGEIAGVGDTTIIRFCRKLGFKGYQGFKMALAQELSHGNNQFSTALNEEILDTDTTDVVIQKLHNISISALQETVSLLKKDDIVKAVDIIKKSNSVHFYGVGSSGVTALDAMLKFMRIGLNVCCYSDGHMMAMDASLRSKTDTVVGISYSGSTKDTVEALRLAKNAGASTICVTHHARSPITQYADVILLNGSREGPLQGGALATKIAQQFVLDVIYTELFRSNRDVAARNRKKTGEAIEEKLY